MKSLWITLPLSSVLLVLVAAAGTQAQGSQNATFDAEEISKISTCGLEKCVIWTIPKVGCTLLNTTCQCSSEVVHRLTEITADCMYANCTITEALELAKIQAAICEFPYESQNEKLKIMTITCAILTYGVISLRLATRFLLGQQLGNDDYCIIAAATTDALFTAFGARFEDKGFGQHIWTIDLDVVPELFLWFWLCEILYVITIALIKYSILFFYLRIFPKRSFRLVCWITMGFCTMSAIAFVLATIFQCQPVPFVWQKNLHGKCLNYNATAWSNAAINILQDVIILIIPISEVRHLHLTTKKKIGMYGMFSVGGLVCVLSMIRLHSLKEFGLTSDPTWDNVNTTFWTTLETTSAIICACMPSIRALGVRYCPKLISTVPSSNSNYGSKTAHPGIIMSHTTRIHSSALDKISERPESQESWIVKPTQATFSTTIVGGKQNVHNTHDTKLAFPSLRFDESETVIKDRISKGLAISLHATPKSDPNWDKSLPPTPKYTIPLSITAAHVGERAARQLHSKFSVNSMRRND